MDEGHKRDSMFFPSQQSYSKIIQVMTEEIYTNSK